MRFYKNNSEPLQEIPILELLDGEVYITEEGARAVYDDEHSELGIIQEPELNLGEKVSTLTDTQLNLYWTLMNNAAKRKKK